MRASDNPLRRDYWSGTVDARILALFRIGLGATIFFDLLDRLRDLHSFYTDGGILPRGALHFASYFRWTILNLSGSNWFVILVFVVALAAAAALTAGWRTRLATVANWALLLSIHHRSLYVCDSGDTVLRVMCFWGMFADLGAVLSLDARLARRSRGLRVPALGLRLLQFQLAMIYVFAAANKTGASWWNGTAVLRALQNSDFARAPGLWVAHAPRLCAGLTWFTLAVEITFPLLALTPIAVRQSRALAILSGLALHGGIFLTMHIGVFSIIMPVCYTLLLQPEWIDRAAGYARRNHGTPVETVAQAADALAPGPAVGRRALALFLGLLLALAATEHVFNSFGRAPPASVQRVLLVTGLWQDWRMFAPDPPTDLFRWEAQGVLTNGTRVDVLAEAAPRMLPASDGFWYSRWYKFRSNCEIERVLLQPFGKYLCRRYNGETRGPKLDRFTLVLHTRPMKVPGPSDPQQDFDYLQQSCIPRAH
jgi:hypothetical protein